VPRLLDGAFGRLRRNVVPDLLDSALRKLDPELGALGQAITTREKLMTASQEEVDNQLRQLEKETKELQRVEDQRPREEELSRKVHEEMNRLLERVQRQGRQALRALDSDDQETDRTLTRPFKAVKSALSGLLSGITMHEERVARLTSREEAQELQTSLTASVVEQLRRILDAGREELRGVTEQLARDEMRKQEQKARPIIVRAAERLSTTFDIKPEIPPLVVSDREIEIGLAAPTVDRTEVREQYEVTEKRRNPWTLWLSKRDVTVTRWRETTEEAYLVDLREIKRQLETAFRHNLDRIRRELQGYVTKDLSEQIHAYYEYLDEFLSQYQRHLDQSRQDFRKTEEDQEALRGQLAGLSAAIGRHRSAVDDYRQRLERLHA
jgi:hypothetical protein